MLRADGKSDILASDAPAQGSRIDTREALYATTVFPYVDASTPQRWVESLLDVFGYIPLSAAMAYSVSLEAVGRREALRQVARILAAAGIIILWPRSARAALPFTDAFTNTDSTTIESHNSNWTATKSSGQFINTNALYQNGSSTVSYRWAGDTFNDDQYSKGTLVAVASSGGSYIGVSVRGASGSTSYVVFAAAGDNNYLRRTTSGSDVVIDDNFGSAHTVSDIYRLEASGSSISVLRNGSHEGASPFTDSTLTSGNAGTCGFGNGTTALRIDDVEVGNLSSATVTPKMSLLGVGP
jgi:hypothetical protein